MDTLQILIVVIVIYLLWKIENISRVLIAVGSDVVRLMTALVNRGVIKISDVDDITVGEANDLFDGRKK